MRVEEIKLKDALGRSQAEETRLCEEVTDYRKRLTAVEVLSGILEAGYQKARVETGATTKALADERLANSDNVERLRKELAEAKAANEERRGRLQRGATEARAANDVGGGFRQFRTHPAYQQQPGERSGSVNSRTTTPRFWKARHRTQPQGGSSCGARNISMTDQWVKGSCCLRSVRSEHHQGHQPAEEVTVRG